MTDEFRRPVVLPAAGRLVPRMPASIASANAQRSDQDCAIEHAEYMADMAEHLLNAINAEDVLFDELTDRGGNDDPLTLGDRFDAAKASRCEAVTFLRSGIYEFRKRAERARQTAEITSEETEATIAIKKG